MKSAQHSPNRFIGVVFEVGRQKEAVLNDGPSLLQLREKLDGVRIGPLNRS